MSVVNDTIDWFADSAHWAGEDGVPHRLVQHLGYTALTVVIAAAIAIPVGLWIGHTGRLRGLAVVGSGALRALPTLGVLTYASLFTGIGIKAAIFTLVLLAIPPLLAGAYAGLESVDRQTIDAARAIGMTEWQILTKVEMPLALPLIVGGFRSADAAGRGDRHGRGIHPRSRRPRPLPHRRPGAQRLPRDGRGSVVVIVLALVLDGIFVLLQRAALGSRPPSRPPQPDPTPTKEKHVHHQAHRRRCRRCSGSFAVRMRQRPDRGREVRVGDTHHDRLGGVPGERDHRRDLRPGAGGQGRQGQEEAQHRRPRGLHPRAQEGRDRPAAGVLRQPAVLPRSQGTATSEADIEEALGDALPDNLEVLEAAKAEDKDSLNVTAEFAAKNNVKTIADLKGVKDLELGANPEFKERAYGIPGLEKVYGITGIKFIPISDSGGPKTLKSLLDGDVDVADIYSTTPSILANKLVTLEDPEEPHRRAAGHPVDQRREGVGQGREVLDDDLGAADDGRPARPQQQEPGRRQDRPGRAGQGMADRQGPDLVPARATNRPAAGDVPVEARSCCAA